jgi:hypothetical protein
MVAENWLKRERRDRLLAGGRRRRRHRRLCRRGAHHRAARDVSTRLRQQIAPANSKRGHVALSDFVAPAGPASPTMSAASP